MNATAASTKPRPRPKSGPWDEIKITLYQGSFDNQGETITLSKAEYIILTGDYELYAKALGGRVTLAEYTNHTSAPNDDSESKKDTIQTR
ncbi:MAG: hypothetical protein AB9869_18005 [Verrucomicrobiia bacterium]